MSHNVNCEEFVAVEKYLDKKDKTEDNHSKAHEIRERFLRSLDPFFFACSRQSVTSNSNKSPRNGILKLIKRKPDYECGFGKHCSNSLFAGQNALIQFHCPLFSLASCISHVETTKNHTQIAFVCAYIESDRAKQLIIFLRDVCSKLDVSFATVDNFASSKKAGNMSQVIFFPSDKFLHHLKRKTFEPGQLKTVVFTEAEDLVSNNLLDEFKMMIKRLPRAAQFVFSFTVAPADLVQDVEALLKDPRDYVGKLQKLYYKGTREYKIKIPDERPGILSEIAAASVYNQVVVFSKDFKSAEKVVEKVSKAQPKSALVYHAHDKEAFDKFDKGELRILVGCENIAPSTTIQKCKLIVNYNQPLHHREYTIQCGRPLSSTHKAVVITLTSEFEEMSLDYTNDRLKEIRTIPFNIDELASKA